MYLHGPSVVKFTSNIPSLHLGKVQYTLFLPFDCGAHTYYTYGITTTKPRNIYEDF